MRKVFQLAMMSFVFLSTWSCALAVKEDTLDLLDRQEHHVSPTTPLRPVRQQTHEEDWTDRFIRWFALGPLSCCGCVEITHVQTSTKDD